MKEFINLIQQNGINGNIIKLMIEEHRPVKDKMIKLYARYKAEIPLEFLFLQES